MLNQVFGRSTPSSPLLPTVQGLAGSSDVSERAVAINLACDHRVSVEREQKFVTFAGSIASTRDLRDAIVDYHTECVQTRDRPDYVYSRLNGGNLIRTRGVTRDGTVNGDRMLIRLLDLNGLGMVYRWGAASKARRAPWFRYLAGRGTSLVSPAQIEAWLDAQLARRSTVNVAFIHAILALLTEYGVAYPFQPVWVSTRDDFTPHLTGGPDSWAQVFGVRKGTGRWLILLAYRARDAGTIARPTQLDGGWYDAHYPSPPNAPLGIGGHPMHLGSSVSATLIPEYIHRQIRVLPQYWDGVGRLVGKTVSSAPVNLEVQRLRHHTRLAVTYGSGVAAWMPAST